MKTQALFKIDSEHQPASFNDVMKRLFPRRPANAEHALAFLKRVRNTEFYRKQWRDYLKKQYPEEARTKQGFKRIENRYFAILVRLKSSGILYSKSNQWKLSDSFYNYLTMSATLYNNWREQEKEVEEK